MQGIQGTVLQLVSFTVIAGDLRPRELAILLAFALFVLGVGLYPTPILEIIRTAAEAWVSGTQ